MTISAGLRLRDYVSLDDDLSEYFDADDFAWNCLDSLEAIVLALGERDNLPRSSGPTGAPVFIHPEARIEPAAHIVGPAYIGQGVEIRHGCYIRDNVVLLRDSTVGHGSEVKNSILFPGAAVPHLSYVGDSVLGYQVNLGAGVILSNLQILGNVAISIPFAGSVTDTGRRKFGAIVGDGTSVGCNTVLNPGVLIGPDSIVYALVSLRKGVYPAHAIIKATGAEPVMKWEG